MVFSPEQANLFNTHDKLMEGIEQIISQFKGWKIIENLSSQEIIWEYAMITQSVINLFMLITIVVGVADYSLRKDKKQFNKTNLNPIFQSVSSFLYAIYPYCLHMPFQHSNFKVFFNSSTNYTYKILGLLNIPVVIAIGWIGIVHDYSYSYKTLDSLSRSENKVNVLSFFLEIAMCLISQSEIEWGYIAFGILINSKLYFCLFQDSFYKKFASKYNLFLVLSTWTLWISCSISKLNFNLSSFNVSLIVITLIPLQIIFSNYIIEQREQYFSQRGFDNQLNELNSFQIEKYCRYLYSFMELDRYEYAQKAQGIIFEASFFSHTSQCKQKLCFCSQFSIDTFDTSENSQFKYRQNYLHKSEIDQSHNIYNQIHGPIQLDDKEERNIFLGFMIINIYKDYFARFGRNYSKVKNLQLSYLNFLIEVMKIPTKSFVELIEIIHNIENLKGNLKSIMKTKQLMKKAQIEFGEFWEKSEIQNQRLNMMSVIDFSDLEISVMKEIRQSLLLKKEFLIYLNNEFVDLNKLYLKGKKYIAVRDQLQRDIQNLFDINPNQKLPQTLAEIFSENFDISRRSTSFYAKQSKLKLLQNLKEEDIGINLFAQRSCMVYISLLHPVGIIKRASSSIEKMFGKKSEEIIGTSCNFMMPDSIASIHDDCLNLFIEKGNLHNLKKGKIFGFGKQQNGFMFAVNSRTKLIQENLVDFGVVGMFEEVNSNYDYFLTSTDGTIIDTTERIFGYCFSDLWKVEKKRIEGLDVCKIIPFLGYYFHIQKKREINYDSMLMCIPITNGMMSFFRKGETQDINNTLIGILNKCKNINQFIFFEVLIRYEQIDTAVDVSVRFIEFTSIKRIKKEADIIESLTKIKLLMENLQNKKLDIDFNSNLNSHVLNQLSLDNQDFDRQAELTIRLGYQMETETLENQEQYSKILQTSNLVNLDNTISFLQGGRSISKEGIGEEKQIISKQDSLQNNLSKTHILQQKPFSKVETSFETNEQIKKLFDQSRDDIEKQAFNQSKISKQDVESVSKFRFEDPSPKNNRNEIRWKNTTIQNSKYEETDSSLTPTRTYLGLTNLNSENKNSIENTRRKMMETKFFAKDQSQIFAFNKSSLLFNQFQSSTSSLKINQKESDELSLIQESSTACMKNRSLNNNSFQKNAIMRVKSQQNQFNIKNKRELEESKFLPQHQRTKKKQIFKDNLQNSQQISSLESQGDNDGYMNKSQSINDSFLKSKNERMTANVAQSSMGSSGSDLHNKKQALIKIIMSKQIPKIAKFFIELGYFSGILILIVSIIQFLIIEQQASQLLNNQKSQESIPVFVNDFSKIIMNVELVRLFTAEVNPTDWEGLADEDLLNLSRKHLGEFREEFSSYLLQNEDISGIAFLNTATMKLVESSYELGPYEVTRTVIQAIQMFFWYIYNYTSDPKDNFEIQAPPNQNFYEILVQIYYFYTHTHSDTVDQLTNSTKELFFIIITIIILSFISVFLIFPVFLNIQQEKEEILKLICTYPPEKLAAYLQFIENTTKDFQQVHQFLNRRSVMTQKTIQNQNKFIKISKHNEFLLKGKKKTISETTKLNKVSIPLLILMLFVLILLLLQPLYAYELDQIYVQKFTESIDTLFIIGNSGVNLSQHFALFFTILNVRRLKDEQGYLQNYQYEQYDHLLNSFKQVIKYSEEISQGLQSLQQKIQENSSLSQSDKQSFLQVIESNMCTEIPLYLNNLKGSLDETYPGFTACTVPKYNEILKTGLILSFHELWSIFQSTLPLFEEKSQNDFEQYLLSFNQQHSFVQMRRVFDNLDAAINVISSIFSAEVQSNSQYLQSYIVGLFAVQLIIIFAVYALLWSGLIIVSRKNFCQVKYMLSIFSIDQLLENQYLSNYLSNHYKLNKIR